MFRFLTTIIVCICFMLGSCQTANETDATLKDVQTIESGDYVYIIQPLRDYLAGLAGGIREQGELDVISKSISLVKAWGKRNQDRLPPVLAMLEDKELQDTDSVAKNLVELRKQMSEAMEEAADVGIQVSDFIPSGILLYGGVSLGTASVGGSTLVGIVIVPLKIIRVSKSKRTDKSDEPLRSESIGFSIALVNISEGDIGVKEVSGNVKAGVGIIFKRLNRATDFVGISTGVNLRVRFPTIGSIDKLIKRRLGVNVQAMCRIGDPKADICLNMAVLVGLEAGKFTGGPRPKNFDFSLAWKAGAIIPLSAKLANPLVGGALDEGIEQQ